MKDERAPMKRGGSLFKTIGIVLVLIIAISMALIAYKKIQGVRRPNVIFIILDAARADHFSCYGYNRSTTPYIDEIARSGVIFQNNFSQDTGTTESMSKIFFSRYFTLKTIQNDSYRFEIKQEDSQSIRKQFDNQQIFLPHVFSLNGYTTAIITDHNLLADEASFVEQFDIHFLFRRQNELGATAQYNRFVPQIVSLMTNDVGRRYFIYWHIDCPHEPYPDGVENQEFLLGIDEKTIKTVKEKMKYRDEDSAKLFNQDEIRCFTGLYDSNLRYVDSLIRALHEKLKNLGKLDNTLIVITADHGENLGDHNSISHGGTNESWDSLTHTPLIILYPSLIPKGTKVKGLTESIDIMPTILDICKIRLPSDKTMDGISLIKYVRHPGNVKDHIFMKNAVRSDKYKYMVTGQLFNIQDDPQEEYNIVKKEPDLEKELDGIYKKNMQPHFDRYNESVRKIQPDRPFYLAISQFSLNPVDIVQTCNAKDRSIAKILKGASIQKAWLLNMSVESGRLYRLPTKSRSLPITLRSDFPNGTYEVYLSLESWQEITSPLHELGLKYRFNAQTNFRYPIHMKLFRKLGQNLFLYYLYAAEITIKDNVFSIDIDFQPPDQNPYVLLHIKFVPSLVKERNDTSSDLEKDEEFKRKTEDLRSLGYL